jgi:hypothetical protein
MKHLDQVTIPPYDTAAVTFDLQVFRPGRFMGCRSLFLDDGNLKEVHVSAEGTAIAPAEKKRMRVAP